MGYRYGIIETDNRVAVSMRIPAQMAATIKRYGEAHGLNKTDAYLHFLQRGIDTENLETSENDYKQALSQLKSALLTFERLEEPR